jgi:hypothetical protein
MWQAKRIQSSRRAGPLCFDHDVTDKMVQEYRRSLQDAILVRYANRKRPWRLIPLSSTGDRHGVLLVNHEGGVSTRDRTSEWLEVLEGPVFMGRHVVCWLGFMRKKTRVPCARLSQSLPLRVNVVARSLLLGALLFATGVGCGEVADGGSSGGAGVTADGGSPSTGGASPTGGVGSDDVPLPGDEAVDPRLQSVLVQPIRVPSGDTTRLIAARYEPSANQLYDGGAVWEFQLYSDGLMISALESNYPPPAIAELRQLRLTEDGIVALLTELDRRGLFAASLNVFDQDYADGSRLGIELSFGEFQQSHHVDDWLFGGPGEATGELLRETFDYLVTFEPPQEWIETAEEPFEVTKYFYLASTLQPPCEDAAPWNADEPFSFVGSNRTCLTFDADDAPLVPTSGQPDNDWRFMQNAACLRVDVRAAFPGQTDCSSAW